MIEPAPHRHQHESLGESLDLLRERACQQHEYLRRASRQIFSELAQLTEADAGVGVIDGAQEAVAELERQLQNHLSKEEHLLFPAFAALAQAERDGSPRPALPFPTVLHPIRLMEAEHMRIQSAVDRLRRATSAMVQPAGELDTWRRCMLGLSQFEGDLLEHHRTENEMLFPLALEVEGRLP